MAIDERRILTDGTVLWTIVAMGLRSAVNSNLLP